MVHSRQKTPTYHFWMIDARLAAIRQPMREDVTMNDWPQRKLPRMSCWNSRLTP